METEECGVGEGKISVWDIMPKISSFTAAIFSKGNDLCYSGDQL